MMLSVDLPNNGNVWQTTEPVKGRPTSKGSYKFEMDTEKQRQHRHDDVRLTKSGNATGVPQHSARGVGSSYVHAFVRGYVSFAMRMRE